MLPDTSKPQKPASLKAPRQKSETVNKRGAARLAAVQALYQMDVAGTGVLETAAEYENFRLGQEIDGEQYLEADAQWFRAILSGVVQYQTELDPLIHNALLDGWPLSRIDSTLRAILRAGAYEMIHRKDVPVPVAITEYVEIAAAFFGDEEPKIVNAVLDRIARAFRSPQQK
jgi:transcription antitermination protein NusB